MFDEFSLFESTSFDDLMSDSYATESYDLFDDSYGYAFEADEAKDDNGGNEGKTSFGDKVKGIGAKIKEILKKFKDGIVNFLKNLKNFLFGNKDASKGPICPHIFGHIKELWVAAKASAEKKVKEESSKSDFLGDYDFDFSLEAIAVPTNKTERNALKVNASREMKRFSTQSDKDDPINANSLQARFDNYQNYGSGTDNKKKNAEFKQKLIKDTAAARDTFEMKYREYEELVKELFKAGDQELANAMKKYAAQYKQWWKSMANNARALKGKEPVKGAPTTEKKSDNAPEKQQLVAAANDAAKNLDATATQAGAATEKAAVNSTDKFKLLDKFRIFIKTLGGFFKAFFASLKLTFGGAKALESAKKSEPAKASGFLGRIAEESYNEGYQAALREHGYGYAEESYDDLFADDYSADDRAYESSESSDEYMRGYYAALADFS